MKGERRVIICKERGREGANRGGVGSMTIGDGYHVSKKTKEIKREGVESRVRSCWENKVRGWRGGSKE